ncbi:MAG: DNA internalization-related competence protein ComEC/Rec2 [Chloroflexi bacterium]|nr:DNA internalization-related competence protein ComEC/Rec2 [Chloroflexota bacterium]
MTLALLSAAWLVGLMLGFQLNVAPLPVFLLAFATLPLGLLLRLAGRSVFPALLVAVLLLGIGRVAVMVEPSLPLVVTDSQQVSLRGQITSDPESTARWTRFVLDVDAIDRGDGWQDLSGKSLVYAEPPAALVSTREPPYFRQGDFLTAPGTLQAPEPFENFDYPAYLTNQGIAGVFWSRDVEWVPEQSTQNWATGRIFGLRRSLSASLESALPQPQSSLAQALLLGLRGGLPSDTRDNFRATGASHLLAISGLHVGILLVMALGGSAGAFGRRWQIYLLLPLAAIWGYALISGLPDSVVRAALMGSLYLLALSLGRPQSILPALALSALVITAFDPLALKQISFQLSFAAMAGIIVALPYQARVAAAIQQGTTPADRWWTIWVRHLGSWLAAALIVSLGAVLATLPLVAFNFNQIPLLGIPITILALPALPFILVASMLTAVAGLVHPLLGQLVGVTAWVPLTYLLTLVSQAPGLTVAGNWVGPPLIWAWYLLLMGLLLLPRAHRCVRQLLQRLTRLAPATTLGHPGPLRPTPLALTSLGIVVILAVSSVLLWLWIPAGSDGNLHVYFFDVGQGDSALIVTPNGRQVLVDGGPDAESATRALSAAMAPSDRSLDLVVLTHLDADHSRGLLEVIDRYQVGAVLVGYQDPTSAMYPQWQARLAQSKVQVVSLSAGQTLLLDEAVTLEILHPPVDLMPGSQANANNNALVFRLTYGEINFLLTADIEAPAEQYLVNSSSGLESEVLKVAHHGSKTSTTPAFLARVNPSVVIISAGSENRYGHPHPDVVARLEQAVGVEGIYRTWEQGTIELVSDGKNLWVETGR